MTNRLERVLALHFDPVQGSPYWCERAAVLGFDPRTRIACVGDLDLLGPFDLDLLTARPVADFMPRGLRHAGPLVLAETGGTTGAPKATAYTPADFHAAFVQPFFDCVDGARIFNGGHWLWLGPSGPHVIGRAAQRIAALSTGADAFSVDFDPRWFRRLTPGSLARTRYLDHLLEQALRVVDQQDIRYLFTTPVVLERLVAALGSAARERVRFVYLGGMAIDADLLLALGAALPAADFLCGYGNTLFGVCHEVRAGRPAAGVRRYFPDGERLLARICCASTSTPVDYGERGQVVMFRLDDSMLLPVVRERDHALRIAPAGEGATDGFADPRPPETASLHIDHGIY